MSEYTIKMSATRISSFLRCRWKYWCQYVERLPRLDNPAFRLGSTCHDTLEFAGRIWQKKGKFTATDKKKILKEYDKISVKEGVEDQQTHVLGKELVSRRVDDFKLGNKIIGLEDKFGFRDTPEVVTPEGVPLMGAIDKAVEIDDNTLLIVDYKTSKTAPDHNQLKSDEQLSIYHIAAKILYPQYDRIILSLDLLKHDIMYTYRTDEEIQAFQEYLVAVYEEMVNLEEKDAKYTVNIFCPWCDFSNNCEGFKRACKKSEYVFTDINDMSNESLLSEWNEVRSTKKVLEGREKALSSIMMEKIKRRSDNIIADGKEVYIRQNSKTTYDVATVSDCVPKKDFAKLVYLNKRATDFYMEKNPTVKSKIQDSSKLSFMSPFLATKKVKK